MKKKWWHEAVVYQIYPRSFQDTTGNGIGDLQGIITRLDYLADLGVDIIWLSPVYQSPMDDNGYDISDYRAIDPLFGTMEDMEKLIAEAKKRDIRIMMDLVVNHTSDEHPWFKASKSSKDNPKRDWYIWKKPGPDGGPPNNWASFFTRSAWAYDEESGEYYLHLFSKKQPDLNWANQEVREEVYDLMHFWLKKGIGGFRMDVINMIGKPLDFPDAALMDEGVAGWEHWANNIRCHEYLREMHEKVLQHYDVVTVGETPFVTTRDGKFYAHPDRKELHMIFQFEHMDLDRDGYMSAPKKLDLPQLKEIMTRWQEDLHQKGWNSNYWNNHDQARAVSRFGDDKVYRIESAKMLGTTLHMMAGTPYIYQGEEVGLTNTYYDKIEDYNDLADHHQYDVMTTDMGLSHQEAMDRLQPFSRDNARVPMRWDGSPHAGFTNGTPWLKLPTNYTSINVENDFHNPKGVFAHYKQLVALRKTSPYRDTIIYGKHKLYLADHPQLYVFERYDQNHRLLVLSNFSDHTLAVPLDLRPKEILLNNYEDPSPNQLRPYESMVLVL